MIYLLLGHFLKFRYALNFLIKKEIYALLKQHFCNKKLAYESSLFLL